MAKNCEFNFNIIPREKPTLCIQTGEGANIMEMFAVTPLNWCEHLDDISSLPRDLDTSRPCLECNRVDENWVCLTCYKVYCSRYINEHMLFHSLSTDHKMVLSYADLSVWCYACDAYVHNRLLMPIKDSAHKHKFGVSIEEQSRQ